MSTAAETREAVRAHPFLVRALRAGVLNYSAAARFLGIEDVDAGAAALRRFAEELPPLEREGPDYRIRMESGVGPVAADESPLIEFGETEIGEDGGDWTAVIAEGEIRVDDVARLLARIADIGVDPIVTGFDAGTLVIVVERAAAPQVLRCAEPAG